MLSCATTSLSQSPWFPHGSGQLLKVSRFGINVVCWWIKWNTRQSNICMLPVTSTPVKQSMNPQPRINSTKQIICTPNYCEYKMLFFSFLIKSINTLQLRDREKCRNDNQLQPLPPSSLHHYPTLKVGDRVGCWLLVAIHNKLPLIHFSHDINGNLKKNILKTYLLSLRVVYLYV